jgi:hypothetical protein
MFPYRDTSFYFIFTSPSFVLVGTSSGGDKMSLLTKHVEPIVFEKDHGVNFHILSQGNPSLSKMFGVLPIGVQYPIIQYIRTPIKFNKEVNVYTCILKYSENYYHQA